MYLLSLRVRTAVTITNPNPVLARHPRLLPRIDAHTGLFERAIVASGPCIVPSEGWGPDTEEAGLKLGNRLMKSLNASSIEELRMMPPQLLQWDNDTLSSDNFAGYSYDHHVLQAWPAEVRAAITGLRARPSGKNVRPSHTCMCMCMLLVLRLTCGAILWRPH